jgi:hypothetical protein
MGRQQHIAILILNTGATQGCVLSPLLYCLITHDRTARHNSNTIIKSADDTTVVGLITNIDEPAYRKEVRDLVVWCQDNNLALKVIIDRAAVQQVESFKFLGVHITNILTSSKHTKTVVKRARQNLFPLTRLKIFGMGPQILKRFSSCTIESGCFTAWYGNCSDFDRKPLQMVV